jgi:hypothetical protein
MGLAVEMRDGAALSAACHALRSWAAPGALFRLRRCFAWLWFLTHLRLPHLPEPDRAEIVGPSSRATRRSRTEFKLVRSFASACTRAVPRTDFNFVARLLEDSGIYWYSSMPTAVKS